MIHFSLATLLLVYLILKDENQKPKSQKSIKASEDPCRGSSSKSGAQPVSHGNSTLWYYAEPPLNWTRSERYIRAQHFATVRAWERYHARRSHLTLFGVSIY